MIIIKARILVNDPETLLQVVPPYSFSLLCSQLPYQLKYQPVGMSLVPCGGTNSTTDNDKVKGGIQFMTVDTHSSSLEVELSEVRDWMTQIYAPVFVFKQKKGGVQRLCMVM